eukprot:6252826-Pyramimonas_sp.AAC.1
MPKKSSWSVSGSSNCRPSCPERPTSTAAAGAASERRCAVDGAGSGPWAPAARSKALPTATRASRTLASRRAHRPCPKYSAAENRSTSASKQ